MTIPGNLILTSTSLAPVLLIYAVVGLFERECVLAVTLGSIGVFLTGLGIILLTHVKRHLGRMSLAFSSVEVADKESVGILVLYLLPLLRTSIADFEFIMLIPAVAIFLALALTGYNYHFNPLLNMFGWTFYKVGTPEGVTYLLITRKSLTNVVNEITVGQLSGHTVIDLE